MNEIQELLFKAGKNNEVIDEDLPWKTAMKRNDVEMGLIILDMDRRIRDNIFNLYGTCTIWS